MAVEPLSPWPVRLSMWVGASDTLTPNWAQWYSNLVLRVNAIAAGGGTFDAGNLTGTTLAANVVNSSLTGVGTLVNLTVTNLIAGSITGNAATATTAPAGTLTGATLAANVLASSLTSVGTLSALAVTGAVTGATFTTGSGTVSTLNNTATTLFTTTAPGLYEVYAYLGVNDATNYTAFATVVLDGTAARIVANNGAGLFLTLSGLAVQARQTSGITINVLYRFLKI
jgi:hypothetical protein